MTLELTQNLAEDALIRVDIELDNAYNVFKWASSGNNLYSTNPAKPLHQTTDSSESFNYFLGFDDLSLKSSVIDLNDQVLTGLANVAIKIKVVMSGGERPAAVPPAKAQKGAPPPVAAPAEVTVLELSIPMHTLIVEKSGNFSIADSFDHIPSSVSLKGPTYKYAEN